MKFNSSALLLAILSAGVTANPIKTSNNDNLSGRDFQGNGGAGRKLAGQEGKKGGMSGKRGGMESGDDDDGDECKGKGKKSAGDDDDCANPVTVPLYQQSYTFNQGQTVPSLGNPAREIQYYAFGWCGNNSGDTWCVYDEGGEGALGNTPRSGDVPNSFFAFLSETGQNAAAFAHTNPEIAGTFSTDEVTTLSWVQSNGGTNPTEAQDALRVGLLVQEMEGQPLSWYVSESTFWFQATPSLPWRAFEIDLAMANFYVVPTTSVSPTYPNLPLSTATQAMLPAGATIVSLGFVWPNAGNVPSPTQKANTGRWDDVVLSGLVCPP
jgi:hypothetical protein